jgi:hypothetical protein
VSPTGSAVSFNHARVIAHTARDERPIHRRPGLDPFSLGRYNTDADIDTT